MNAKSVLESLTLEDYETIFHDLGVNEIKKQAEYWVLPTLCHNLDIESASYKLYFYLNTRTTFCFTECQKSRDIIDLIADRWKLEHREFQFQDILNYICRTCNIKKHNNVLNNTTNTLSWKKRLSVYNPTKNTHYLGKRYDKDILKFLQPYQHEMFLNDGISGQTMEKFNIGFYPAKNQITIPVYDLNGALVGIHCRNVVLRDNKTPKYIPLRTVSGLDYRFKQHEVLYGLNMNEPYIRHTKQIQLFESPKSVLQLDSMYPQNNAVGMFGMNLGKERRDMILELGVSEVVIGIDKDYVEHEWLTDAQTPFTTYLHNVNKIAKLFHGYCKVTVLYDGDDDLGYKDAPTDKGKEIYEKLYKNRMVVDG